MKFLIRSTPTHSLQVATWISCARRFVLIRPFPVHFSMHWQSKSIYVQFMIKLKMWWWIINIQELEMRQWTVVVDCYQTRLDQITSLCRASSELDSSSKRALRSEGTKVHAQPRSSRRSLNLDLVSVGSTESWWEFRIFVLVFTF